MAEAGIKIRCGCGGRIVIPFDLLIKQRDEMAIQFYEHHTTCNEALLMKAHAVNDIAKTLEDVNATLNEFLQLAQRDCEQ